MWTPAHFHYIAGIRHIHSIADVWSKWFRGTRMFGNMRAEKTFRDRALQQAPHAAPKLWQAHLSITFRTDICNTPSPLFTSLPPVMQTYGFVGRSIDRYPE